MVRLSTVITLRAELDAAHAEIARLRAFITSAPALEAILHPPVHIIDPDKDLTAREFETLNYITAGCSNDEIALNMYVSVHTVKTHIQNLFAKMHVHNRAQAAVTGIQLGLRTEDTPCM